MWRNGGCNGDALQYPPLPILGHPGGTAGNGRQIRNLQPRKPPPTNFHDFWWPGEARGRGRHLGYCSGSRRNSGAGARTRINLFLVCAGTRRATKNSGIFGGAAEEFPGYRLRGLIPNWELVLTVPPLKFRYISTNCYMYYGYTAITVI